MRQVNQYVSIRSMRSAAMLAGLYYYKIELVSAVLET